MTMQVKITGYSDDTVCVEGGVLDDEFGSFKYPCFLHFSDGTIVKAEHCPKLPEGGHYNGWKIELVTLGSTTTHDRKPGSPRVGDYDGDELILSGEYLWVDGWGSESPTSDELIEAIERKIDDGDALRGIDTARLWKIWNLLRV